MSEVQNHLGEKFKETIAEAMKTGDFRALNTLVSDTVNDALREADFQANLSREAAEKRVWNSQRSCRIKSGKKRSPKSRSRRSVKNGKDSGRNTADRMRSGTDSEKNGKNNGKNSVRHRRRRTVLEIRPVSGHPERLRLWR